jgi:Ca2+-transporting ATPase
LEIIPFNSKRKRACTAVLHPSIPDTVRVFLKGAPDVILDFCDRTFDAEGNIIDLSEKAKDDIIHKTVKGFADKALRTLLVAYTDISVHEFENMKSSNNGFAHERDREVLEAGMIMIGIFALMDPLRPEIVESVIKCNKAGINIRMVTGDNLDTAIAIAIEAGILTAA